MPNFPSTSPSLNLSSLVNSMLEQGVSLLKNGDELDTVGVEILDLSLSELEKLKSELIKKSDELLNRELVLKNSFDIVDIVDGIRDFIKKFACINLPKTKRCKKIDECLLSDHVLKSLIDLVNDQILQKIRAEHFSLPEDEELKLKLIDDLVREGSIDIASSRKIKLTDKDSIVGGEDDWVTMEICTSESDDISRDFILKNYKQFKIKLELLDNISSPEKFNGFFINHGFCVYIDTSQNPGKPSKAILRAKTLNIWLLTNNFPKLIKEKNVSVTIGNEDRISAHSKNGADNSLAITVCYSASPDDNLKYILDAVKSYDDHLRKARVDGI
ncbi:MAG: hypothetical protein WC806_03735 [Candidatus Gracilibacteria bacterium]|jgi:hypothetical protein